MLGQAASLKLGNQKLVSIDSIALFGIIGLLAAIGAVMSHNFQNNESNYLASFGPVNIPVASFDFNFTCWTHPDVDCGDYYLVVTVNCTKGSPVCGDNMDGVAKFYDFGEDFADWNATLEQFILPIYICVFQNPTPHPFNCAGRTSDIIPGFMSSDDNTDFRFFATAVCDRWCNDTTWMYRLCVAVAGLCVGFSGLVFLYLYLGCILERLYPRRRLERLANLVLMRGEEAPKLERTNTSSKSESIRPDLKEY